MNHKYIISGTYNEYINWIDEEKELKRFNHYVKEPLCIIPLDVKKNQIIFTGTWIYREDLNDVMDLVKSIHENGE